MSEPISIDWEALELAVERNAPEIESFLDTTSGQIITLTDGDPEEPLLRRKVSDNIRQMLRIEPASSREQYRWMEKFVGSVAEPALRERLVISIDGKGAFRRFKDVLMAFPAERERWFSYRAELLHWHIHNWLIEHGVNAGNTPPWGEAKPPVDLPAVDVQPSLSPSEAPGEMLRRQARELIEGLPAIDLPTAIAFLQFLNEKSTGSRATEKHPEIPRVFE